MSSISEVPLTSTKVSRRRKPGCPGSGSMPSSRKGEDLEMLQQTLLYSIFCQCLSYLLCIIVGFFCSRTRHQWYFCTKLAIPSERRGFIRNENHLQTYPTSGTARWIAYPKNPTRLPLSGHHNHAPPGGVQIDARTGLLS